MKVENWLTVTNVGFILIVVGHCFCSPAPRASTLINKQQKMTWYNTFFLFRSFLVHFFLVSAYTVSQRDRHRYSFSCFFSLSGVSPPWSWSRSVSFSCSHLPFFLYTIHRLWWVMLITHPAFVSMLPLWCVHFKILIVMETIPIFICLKNPLQKMKKVGVSD